MDSPTIDPIPRIAANRLIFGQEMKGDQLLNTETRTRSTSRKIRPGASASATRPQGYPQALFAVSG